VRAHRTARRGGTRIRLLGDQSFRAGKLVDKGLHLVRGAFLAQEVQNDADRLFRGSLVDANIGDKTPDQFFHGPLIHPH